MGREIPPPEGESEIEWGRAGADLDPRLVALTYSPDTSYDLPEDFDLPDAARITLAAAAEAAVLCARAHRRSSDPHMAFYLQIQPHMEAAMAFLASEVPDRARGAEAAAALHYVVAVALHYRTDMTLAHGFWTLLFEHFARNTGLRVREAVGSDEGGLMLRIEDGETIYCEFRQVVALLGHLLHARSTRR